MEQFTKYICIRYTSQLRYTGNELNEVIGTLDKVYYHIQQYMPASYYHATCYLAKNKLLSTYTRLFISTTPIKYIDSPIPSNTIFLLQRNYCDYYESELIRNLNNNNDLISDIGTIPTFDSAP
jgi:hypothetical protein